MPRAPKKCGNPTCTTRVEGRPYCPEHTRLFATSTRRKRLPPDWPKRRDAVKARAHGRCEARIHHRDCDGTGTECDHIREGDNHELTNLQWLNAHCHAAKTRAETRQRNQARYRRP